MVGFALGDILIWMTVGMSKPLGRALSDRKELPFRANFIRVGLVRFPQITDMLCLPGAVALPFPVRKVTWSFRSVVTKSSA